MKINSIPYNMGNNGITKAAENEVLQKAKNDAVVRSSNTDKIDISGEGAYKAEIDMYTKNIVAEIEAPAKPERLAELRTAVQNGTYYVPTSSLVDSIMQRWLGL